MRVYHDFSLLPESRSTFPEVDPDPTKLYGSNRIRIRNTDFNLQTLLVGLKRDYLDSFLFDWGSNTLLALKSVLDVYCIIYLFFYPPRRTKHMDLS